MKWKHSLLKTESTEIENAAVYISIALYNFPIAQYDLSKAGAIIRNTRLKIEHDYNVKSYKAVDQHLLNNKDLLWLALHYVAQACTENNPRFIASSLREAEACLRTYWKRTTR